MRTNRYKELLVAFGLILTVAVLRGQPVTIQSMLPPAGVVTVDMAGTFSAINSGSNPLSVSLQVDVEDATGNLVVQLASDLVALNVGPNVYGAAAGTAYGQYYGSAPQSVIVQQMGMLPVGSYNVCYYILSGDDGSQMAFLCSELEVSGASGPEIIAPADDDTTTQCSPLLTWSPLMPFVMGTTYSMVLSEVLEGQSASDALLSNPPLLSLNGLEQSLYVLNPATVGLEEGGQYVFQVQAVNGNNILGASEVVNFWYSCVEGEENEVPDNSFKFALKDMDGGYYVVTDTLRFAYDNWAEEDSLDYEIFTYNNSGDKIDIPNVVLPVYILTPGNNYFKLCVLDLDEYMVDNRLYIMRIRNKSNDFYYSKFVYKDAE